MTEIKTSRCKICSHLAVVNGRCGWCGVGKWQAGAIKEKHIRGSIVRWLTALGTFCWVNDTVGIYDAKRGVFRTNANRLRGVADILGMIGDGKLLAIEVKRGLNKCSEEQVYFLDRVRREGGVAIEARCIRDVQAALEAAGIDIDAKHRKCGL